MALLVFKEPVSATVIYASEITSSFDSFHDIEHHVFEGNKCEKSYNYL